MRLENDMLRFCKAEKFANDPGSPIHDLYSGKVEKDGTVNLVKVGEENIQDMINANKDSTDIATIVAYYNQTGDESVLKRMTPTYGDLTVLPKSLAEFLQLRIDSQNFFDALPENVKAQFNYDSNKFFAQAGEESWYKALEPVVEEYGKDVPNTDESVVNEDAS